MKALIYILIYPVLGSVILSCSSSKPIVYSSEEYLSWYHSDNNGLGLSSEKNNVITKIKLRPLEYDAALCLQKACDSKSNIKEQLNTEKRTVTFNLHYDLPGIGLFDINPRFMYKTDRMEYFSFKLKDNIYLISYSGDSTKCLNVIYERTPPQLPFANFELFFGQVDVSNYEFLSIKNSVIDTNATLFDLKSINFNVPQIKIKDENK